MSLSFSASNLYVLSQVTGAVWMVVVPVTLLFGSDSKSPSIQWYRSTPLNNSYDGMLVAVTSSLALIHFWLAWLHVIKKVQHKVNCLDEVTTETNGTVKTPDNELCVTLDPWMHPDNALDGFHVLFLLLTSILFYVGETTVTASLFLLGFILQICLWGCYSWCTRRRHYHWPPLPNPRRSSHQLIGLWCLRVWWVLLAIGFISFPVFRPWDGPVSHFVRWFEYSERGELVWRGIFASYAIMFLYGCLDPLQRHRFFTWFVILSSVIHATVMLVMNLYERNNQLPNGNPEHLYGDVAGWFGIGVVSAFCFALTW
jgi:hypothetical protein